MGGNKLMGIAVMFLGVALIVLGMGMAYRNLNSVQNTENNNNNNNIKPYNESSYIEIIE